jgi:hypothetical protein
MRLRYPWFWTVGSFSAILLLAGVLWYWRFNEALRGDYETVRVIQIIEDYVRMHDGNWPSAWDELDDVQTDRERSSLGSSYWRRYTSVDFTLTSEQLIENPDLISDAVKPLNSEYIVYPHARQDLNDLMQAIREAKRLPKRPDR